MSFLNQLKSQANALQSQQSQTQASLDENTRATEEACRVALGFLQDPARQTKRDALDELAKLIVGEPSRFV